MNSGILVWCDMKFHCSISVPTWALKFLLVKFSLSQLSMGFILWNISITPCKFWFYFGLWSHMIQIHKYHHIISLIFLS
jgi:hypothetical protein